MKIISYNINGVRAATKNGLANFIEKENADIFCFQETRADEAVVQDLLGRFAGYNLYSAEGERKGYSGVAALTKQKPLQVVTNCFAFDNEGRVLVLEFEKFYIVNVYVPNGANRLEFKLLFLEKLLRELKTKLMPKKDVIICTDFNISFSPLDLSNPEGCKNTTGYLVEERDAFSDFFASGFVDSFRILHPFSQRFTWSSYGAKRIDNAAGNLYTFDYILVTRGLEKRVCESSVLLHVDCSDHYPVQMEMK